LQYTVGGPCVDALRDGEPIQITDNLTADHVEPRGSGFRLISATVGRTPVRSVLLYRLSVEPDHPVASLNLYATKPDAFAPDTSAPGPVGRAGRHCLRLPLRA
jgi:hypothetical protein